MVEGNLDYREYLEWVALGNVPEPEFTTDETLSNAKEAKRIEIRAAYVLDSESPVTVNSVAYQGGFDSAIKLDAARRLSEAGGAVKVTFFDCSNNARILSLVDAQVVILTVASAFQTSFARKQLAMVAVDNATTESEVNLIIY
jgi:hypothetical protein